jgi:hypothetical protein
MQWYLGITSWWARLPHEAVTTTVRIASITEPYHRGRAIVVDHRLCTLRFWRVLCHH